MNDKDSQILTLLNQGRSYREIAEELEVSTRRIAEVKKTWFQDETASDEGFGQQENTKTSMDEENILMHSHGGKQNQSNKPQKTNAMEENYTNENRNQGNPDNDFASIEIRKAELEHDLAIKTLEMRQRERDRDLEWQKIQLEERKLAAEERKKESEIDDKIRTLQFQCLQIFKKSVQRYWVYEDAISIFDDIAAIISIINETCYVHERNASDFFEIETLNTLHQVFDKFTDDWDEDIEKKSLEHSYALARKLRNLVY